MIGRKRRFGPGAAVSFAVLVAILAGMSGEWGKEADRVFDDFLPLPTDYIAGTARVIDADTLDVDGQRVRLFGVDAVEKNQICQDGTGKDWPCGRQASEDLDRAIGGRDVRCISHETDRYGRAVADCEIAGMSINYWVVQQGWAVAYTRYSRAYEQVEAEARAKRSGIFAGTFDAPEDWRRRQR